MKKFQNCVVWIVSVTTFGSGLINLYSVMGPGLPERMQVLRQLFPMEFLHLARFLTLLIGFALVISSLHLRRRKTRAFRIVFLLACLSVAFHLTKGLDYAEAGFSMGLVVLLILSRRSFDRPVVYRFSTLPQERAKAEAIVRRHSTTTQDFFKIWPDKSFFFSDSGNSFLAYRVSNSFAVVLGDPVGPPEELRDII